MAPRAAEARPFPKEETTPPVMKINRAMGVQSKRESRQTSSEKSLQIVRTCAQLRTRDQSTTCFAAIRLVRCWNGRRFRRRFGRLWMAERDNGLSRAGRCLLIQDRSGLGPPVQCEQ